MEQYLGQIYLWSQCFELILTWKEFGRGLNVKMFDNRKYW